MKKVYKKTPIKESLGLAIALAPVLFLLALIYKRINFIDINFGTAVNCLGCFNQTVFINDLPYLLFLMITILLGFTIKNIILSRFFRIASILTVIIYLGDILISQELTSRLLYGDAIVFLQQFSIIRQHLTNTNFFSNAAITATLAAILITLLFMAWPSLKLFSGKLGKILISISFIAFFISIFIPTTQYIHNWALDNVIAVNLKRGETTPYSEKTINTALVAESKKATPTCTPGRNENYDLIVLILESWSPYQSAVFSGLNDWTPQLDKIAKQHAYYMNMHASGFTTNEGLMGMLAEVELLSTGKIRTPFVTAWGYDKTLPKLLKKNGYYTSFLTTGNLEFSDKDKWLKHIGFDHTEGHDHPFYEGMKRMHFDAAPDEALYERTIQHLNEIEEVDNKLGRTPYLVVVENVSSHHPYVHPHTGERDREAVFRYMDDTAADFYQKLEDRGYFKQGRLLIISDHRAMVPVEKNEHELLGRSTLSKIPAILIGPNVQKGPIETLFHQTDLIDTMERVVAKQSCNEHGVRDLLSPEETEPRCIYHGRGDSRELVNVFCSDGEGTIRLAGDNTTMLDSKGLNKVRQQEIIDWLNHYRILRDERQQQWDDSKP